MTLVTVTAFTAARSLEIEETAIVEGKIVGDNLVLTILWMRVRTCRASNIERRLP